MKNLVLDTHVFLWLLEGNPKLPGALREVIDDPTSDLYLPVLVVAEMVDLISKGRSPLSMSNLDIALHSDPRLSVVPMTEEIALSGVRFIALPDIHDRCIVATTAKLIETVPDAVLATGDRAIRSFAFVPTMWH